MSADFEALPTWKQLAWVSMSPEERRQVADFARTKRLTMHEAIDRWLQLPVTATNTTDPDSGEHKEGV